MQHVSAFTEDIVNHGRRVLLVGHSQGNLYANAAHRLLYRNEKIEPGNFSVVGIASPAGFVAGNGPYLTSNSDLVISALHSVVQTLPPNIEIPFHLEDVSGHNFLATYMNVAYPGVSKISATVKSNLAMLEPPKSTYDYSINMSIVSMSTSPTDQTLDAIYPLRFCNIDPIIFLWYEYVRSNCIAYIKNDAGLGFDPDGSPEFSTIANAALNRIIRFAPEAADPDAAITQLFTATWPRLNTASQCGGDGSDCRYWTPDYDVNMKIGQVPPRVLDFNEAPSSVAPYPLPREVFNVKLIPSLENSIAKLKGKVSYEAGDEERISVPFYEGVILYRTVRSYKVRICKNGATSI